MGPKRGRVGNTAEPPGRGEVHEVVPGLWIWRTTHRDWMEGQGWDPVVTCTYVESEQERLVLDPLAPPPGSQAWERLERNPPTAVVVLKPDHVRDVDFFAERFGIPAFGPDRFLRDEVPESRLKPIFPGSRLPGGLVALHDGRGRNETPLWLPLQRTLVFADGLTAPQGELRVWGTPWHEERTLPALRELLRLPFETVIVSHGNPVHSRVEYERVLDREPWEPRSKEAGAPVSTVPDGGTRHDLSGDRRGRSGRTRSAERRPVEVKRIVANIATEDPANADPFYRDILGLDLLMDHGWIRTYGQESSGPVQVSFASHGGSGTPVPDLSVEVDDLSGVLARVEDAGLRIEYGPVSEPWGVRRFFVRDPLGRLVNILEHE